MNNIMASCLKIKKANEVSKKPNSSLSNQLTEISMNVEALNSEINRL